MAIRKKVVSPDQVDECLSEQEAAVVRGEPRPPLGAVLLRKGFITDEAVAAFEQVAREFPAQSACARAEIEKTRSRPKR